MSTERVVVAYLRAWAGDAAYARALSTRTLSGRDPATTTPAYFGMSLFHKTICNIQSDMLFECGVRASLRYRIARRCRRVVGHVRMLVWCGGGGQARQAQGMMKGAQQQGCVM